MAGQVILALHLTPGPGVGPQPPARDQAESLRKGGPGCQLGPEGLVLGSSERRAHVPFLARPPTSRAASLPWPRAKTIYLGSAVLECLPKATIGPASLGVLWDESCSERRKVTKESAGQAWWHMTLRTGGGSV